MEPESLTLPPGPSKWPLFQSLSYFKNPENIFRESAQKFGAWYTIRFLNLPPIVVCNSPEAVRQILKLREDECMHLDASLDVVFKPLVGNFSIPILDGEIHMQHRKLMLPAFQSRNLASYRAAILQTCEEHISQWQPGNSLVLLEEMRSLGLRILLRTAFGLQDGPFQNSLHEAGLAYSTNLIHPNTIAACSMPLYRYPGSPWKKALESLEQIRELFSTEISRFRSGQACELQILCEHYQAMSDAGIRDELVTLLTAGTDTSAISASWCCYDILANPECYESLCNEIDSMTDADIVNADNHQGNEYLNALIRESMRMHPVTTGIGRKLLKTLTIDGVTLPAGTLLATDQFTYNQNPQLWPQPAIFNPQRFITGGGKDVPALTFGGGVRRCIGHAYAFLEIRLIMIALFRNLTLSLVNKTLPETTTHGILFGPKGGVQVRVTGPRMRQ